MARNPFTDRSGSVAIEFSLILPILVTMCLGMFEVEEAVRAYMKTSLAAQTMATVVAIQSSVTPATMTDYCAGAKLVMAPYATGTLQIAVISVTNNGGTVQVDWTDVTCGGATAPTSAAAIALASSMVPTATNSVIIAQATYTYTSPMVFILPSTYTFTQTAFSRPRNQPTPSTGNWTITHS